MNTVLIKANGENLAEFNLPASLREVPLKRFIGFLVKSRSMGEPGTNPAKVMAEAVSEFLEYPLSEILEARVGDNTVKGLDGTLRQLYGYIIDMIGNQRGKHRDANTAAFNYEGVDYFIPFVSEQAIAGEAHLPDLSVIEVIEAAEIQRYTQAKIDYDGDPDGSLKKKIMDLAAVESIDLPAGDARREKIKQAAENIAQEETERMGDQNGSQVYSMYLKMLAVLAKKKGERMPLEDAAREAWISERAAHFRNISAADALDVDFFLHNISSRSGKSLPLVGFLSRQSFAAVAETRLRKEPHLTRPQRKTNKSSNE